MHGFNKTLSLACSGWGLARDTTRFQSSLRSLKYLWYHLPRICRTLVPEIYLRPEMLHVFRYIDVLMCLINKCMLIYMLSAVKTINEDRYR